MKAQSMVRPPRSALRCRFSPG